MNRKWKDVVSELFIVLNDHEHELIIRHSGHEFTAVHGEDFAGASDGEFCIELAPISGKHEGHPLTKAELAEVVDQYYDEIVEKIMEEE